MSNNKNVKKKEFFDKVNACKDYLKKNGKKIDATTFQMVLPNGERGLYYLQLNKDKFVVFSPVNLPSHIGEEKRIWKSNITVARQMIDDAIKSESNRNVALTNPFACLEVEEAVESFPSLLKARFPKTTQKEKRQVGRTSPIGAVYNFSDEEITFPSEKEVEEEKKEENTSLTKSDFPSLCQKNGGNSPVKDWKEKAIENRIPYIPLPKKKVDVQAVIDSVKEKAFELYKKHNFVLDFAKSTGKKSDHLKTKRTFQKYTEYCTNNSICKIKEGLDIQQRAVVAFKQMQKAFGESQTEAPANKSFLKTLNDFVKLSKEKKFISEGLTEEEIEILPVIEAEVGYITAHWFPVEKN